MMYRSRLFHQLPQQSRFADTRLSADNNISGRELRIPEMVVDGLEDKTPSHKLPFPFPHKVFKGAHPNVARKRCLLEEAEDNVAEDVCGRCVIADDYSLR